MTVDPQRIAHIVQTQFQKQPAKRKPAVRGNGLHEWVPLSGIVAQDPDGNLYCLSMATGMKCLPSSKLPQAQGNVIHDWHAEVLAIRAFNRFVLDECRKLAAEDDCSSLFLYRRTEGSNNAPTPLKWHAQPFTWRKEMSLHMYCSEAPCGDASMELTMEAQEDASPWEAPVTASSASPAAVVPSPIDAEDNGTGSTTLLGRGFFSQLGVVRRKPARGDAPLTLSKSCSDKLSLKQCTSLLSSVTSLLVNPEHVYLTTVVMPESQFSATGCTRAFSTDSTMSGRMAPVLQSSLSHANDGPAKDNITTLGGYHFHNFKMLTVPSGSPMTDEFHYSRRSVTSRAASATATAPKIAASNLAVAWTRSGLEEGTLGGVLQGRKAFDPRGASFTSRRKMWSLAVDVADILVASGDDASGDNACAGNGCSLTPGSVTELRDVLRNSNTYADLKSSPMLAARRSAKAIAKEEALKGWVSNSGDDGFNLA